MSSSSSTESNDSEKDSTVEAKETADSGADEPLVGNRANVSDDVLTHEHDEVLEEPDVVVEEGDEVLEEPVALDDEVEPDHPAPPPPAARAKPERLSGAR